MKSNLKKRCISFSFLIFIFFHSFAESFEFVNKDIGDILYAVSLYKGFPVFSDDTVVGNATFRLSGEDFDESFDSFLTKSRLYVEKDEKRWIVSKIKFQEETLNSDESINYSLDAFDVTPNRLFEYIAQKTGICITYENLPQNKISVHTGICSIDEIVKRVTGLCFGFSSKRDISGVFHISRFEEAQELTLKNGKADFTKLEDGTIKCDIQNAPLSYATEKLCSMENKEYCFSLSNDSRILRANFISKDFDSALLNVCILGGAEISKNENVYFINSSKNKDLSLNGKKWYENEIKNIKLQDFISLVSKRFPNISIIPFDSNCSNGKYLYFCSDSQKNEFEEFSKIIDIKNESRLVQLKYIRTEEFLKNLPPFIEKSSVTDSGRGDSFYFTGSESSYENLMSHIKEFDRPVSRISYDLLIMQYQKTKGDNWKPNLSAKNVSIGDMTNASGTIGSMLDLNLDVVGIFGLKFAASLQAAINESKAKVYADTTLNGVSGSTINFQNTNTYRYRDNNLDPETGKPIYSGITKEITSGLKLDINGVVTGDGMITSKITASVSRQGSDLSTVTGNPPPSSEKLVTTEVRSKSGEPVILSGLIQEEETESVSRVPFISRIPLIGLLFKSKEIVKEKSELVIYLVPKAEIFNIEESTVSDGTKKKIKPIKKAELIEESREILNKNMNSTFDDIEIQKKKYKKL